MSRTSSPSTGALPQAQRRQLIWITAAAIAIYVTMRLLPTGTNLNHTDFQVKGKNSIEFCDAQNPQFIPVVAVASPVTMTVATTTTPTAGHSVDGVLTLRTFSGKGITPQDLLEVHTKLMHLMIVDPSLTDYEHVHPQPGKTPGSWTFSFSPRYAGTYRLFADFTPIATARGLYAEADVEVTGAAAVPAAATASSETENGRAASAADHPALGQGVDREGYRFTLKSATMPVRAREPIDLTFAVAAPNGGRVPLAPIMGAYAHLVAFDAKRSGFAHLHPNQSDPLAAPDATHPELKFKVTIPSAGRYVIWTQVNLGGHEVFAPYWFDVE